jgi:16S rRNA processing protein RimM
MTERFVAALVGAPFGLDGRVKIRSLSGETEHFFRLKKITLRRDGAERDYAVEGFFPRPLSVKLAGIDSPEAAKALAGAELLTERSEAAPLAEGEFYIEDLKGLTVYGGGSAILGTIADVLEGGGGFLAEIVLVSGEKRLVPFRDEFFGAVDLENSRTELLAAWILE